jgi:hypothetical protein
MPINRYTVLAFLFLALCMVVSACKPDDQDAASAQDRHRAAMKDLGHNDYVPVRNPWAIDEEKKKP